MSEPEFVYVIYVQTTAQRLYEALTDPEFVKVYMGDTGPRSTWEVGAPVLWKSEPEGEFEELGQRVLEAVPGRRLAYTWHTLQPRHREMFAWTSDEEFEEARRERSRVAFDIEQAEVHGLGVKLTITHDGFRSPESRMLQGVREGWVMIASALKTMLEGGRLVHED
ncbi:SRPBCC domain-containing protein [Streptomyces sp. JJ36]|uniref:SRPBCC domain-containing protein n=1 Tax=Streptomyces sp. JJ36 TaxID=2736645 RepID=UPI001F3D2EA2|nr:SRPBCC domain-containing protein [Streptomyces sp. JJ36]MCF6524421.1 SRPBCC domain-containing protein [Streptomyces sp. JJ36]